MANKRPRGLQTAGQILRVARSLFCISGYHNCGLQDILQAAGVTKGSFYHHFDSKEQLASRLLEQLDEELRRHYIQPVMAERSVAERLESAFERLIRLRSHPDGLHLRLLAMLAADLVEGDYRLAEQLNQQIAVLSEFWSDILAQAGGEGLVSRKLQPEIVAMLIISTVFGAELLGKQRVGGAEFSDLLEQLRWLITT